MEIIDNFYNLDCLDGMRQMTDECVDLTITSPPYDNLRKYKGYTFDFELIAKELYRITKNGGVLVWVVGDACIKGSETCTSFKQALYFREIGFNLNDTMIWQKTNPMPQVKQKRYNQVFEYMFIFSKGTVKTFNPIKIPCKSAGQHYNSTCKNMGGESGRTYKEFKINKEKVDDNIWKIAIARNNTEHPAVFPEELVKRHILSWSNESDLVFDPFLGSGTTAKVAKELNRHYFGFEISKDYCEIIKKRLLSQ